MIWTFLTVMLCDAMYDFGTIRKNIYVKHGQKVIIMSGVYLAVAALHYLIGMSWQMVVCQLAYVPALRWLVHDAALNYLRGLSWDYLGVNSTLDRFLRAFHARTKIHPIFLKIALFLISVIGASLIYALWLHEPLTAYPETYTKSA